MKALVCEMCNSTDLIKQDGFFVCQSCGMKYSLEEAKKMMVEGTVKVDNSDFVQKYLQNARRAKQKEDWTEAEKYYNMVEQNDPTNIEAIFYSTFARVKTALLEAESKDKRQGVFNILIKGVSIIDDNYDNTNEEHQKLLFEIIDDIKGLKAGKIVPTTHLANYETKNGYGNVVGRSQQIENDSLDVTYNMIDDVLAAFMESLVNIIVAHPEESIKKPFVANVNYLPMASEAHEKVAPHINGYKTPATVCVEIAKQVRMDDDTKGAAINAQIHTLGKTVCPMFMNGTELNPSLVGMVRGELRKMHPNAKAFKSGCCYVATAVYGSYNCPEVWTLRRFRDDRLAETWYGRAFVKTYYAISPTLVKWFGHTEWFKKMWRSTLDRMVKKLRTKGFESSPYEDKEW